jgi:rhomboid protease GluP
VLLIFIPSLGARLARRLILRQQYGRARRLMLVLRCFHPSLHWRWQPRLLHAWELALKGEFAAAEKIFEQLPGDESAWGREARINLLRLKGDWKQIFEWSQQEEGKKLVQDDPTSLSVYLRALGEMGQLELLLQAFQDSRKQLASSGYAAVRPLCRLMLFAFLGSRDGVDRLLRGALAAMPEGNRVFWQATADLTGGNAERARAALEEIKLRCDPMVRNGVERRLTQPLVDAVAMAPAQRDAVLQQALVELEEEERFGSLRPVGHGRPYVSYAIVAANLVAFAAELIAGGATNPEVLHRLGALWPPEVIAGQWWRIFAAQFLHWGSLHLIMNMLGLLLFGPYLEAALGRLRYFAVYAITGSAAMFFVVLLHWHDAAETQPLVVGASGGVLGLVGATTSVMLLGWRREKAQLAKRRLITMASILVMQAAFDFSIPQVSFAAHSAGAVVGVLLTLLLGYRLRDRAGGKS